MDNLSMNATVKQLSERKGLSPISPLKSEVIDVTIDPTIVMDEFSESYYDAIMSKNGDVLDRINLTKEDLKVYFRNLLFYRVALIAGKTQAKDWDLVSDLWIPSVIQYVLTCIGRVEDLEKGLIFQPKCDEKYDIAKMQEVSAKLKHLVNLGYALVNEAMPRSKHGDKDVMQCAILNDLLIVATRRVDHPSAAYVAATLGLKVEQTVIDSLLYRVHYDSISKIKNALLSEPGLW